MEILLLYIVFVFDTLVHKNDDSGNYLTNPPEGFWPEYLSAINDSIIAAYKPAYPQFTGTCIGCPKRLHWMTESD
jgi:hypothetical protein